MIHLTKVIIQVFLSILLIFWLHAGFANIPQEPTVCANLHPWNVDYKTLPSLMMNRGIIICSHKMTHDLMENYDLRQNTDCNQTTRISSM